MFDLAKAFPLKATTICLWLCSVCGAPFYYGQQDGAHGGPTKRASDRRYSAPMQGPCWKSKEYGVKCATPKGWRVMYHEGAPNPEQPEQTDAVWVTD